jgi:hypothetical protein
MLFQDAKKKVSIFQRQPNHMAIRPFRSNHQAYNVESAHRPRTAKVTTWHVQNKRQDKNREHPETFQGQVDSTKIFITDLGPHKILTRRQDHVRKVKHLAK